MRREILEKRAVTYSRTTWRGALISAATLSFCGLVAFVVFLLVERGLSTIHLGALVAGEGCSALDHGQDGLGDGRGVLGDPPEALKCFMNREGQLLKALANGGVGTTFGTVKDLNELALFLKRKVRMLEKARE